MQINRLFEIIYLLLDKETMTAAELAEHFEVSTRTVYRDIETLSQTGIPIYAIKGKGGGIRLTENFVLNKSVLTGEEQKKILQSLHGMNAVREEEIKPLLSKLSALFGGEQEDWIEIEFSSWNAHDAVSKKFALLKETIFFHKKVSFCYNGANGISGRRIAEPLKLIFRANAWYLYAWCTEKKDFRFFKLSRMEEITALEEHFERRKIPDLWNKEEEGKRKNTYMKNLITVVALISPGKAYRVLEELDKKNVEKLEDGKYKVRIVIPEDDWMYQYLMTYGADLEVLEPERVRKNMIEKLKSALENYI
ncbi:MAG: YafY family transcriptional regulator [Clostridiales bacterium]|nr:YafY family transcriptional regulator [Clostridiales bacterium]